MARKPSENPQLDMTPMIDVVFELIIFFVVTLKMSAEKDESIVLEDGRDGIKLTPEELPPSHMIVDVGLKTTPTGQVREGTCRISMMNMEISVQELGRRIRERYRLYNGEFPVLIRADYRVEHRYIKQVLDACTENKIWKISFVAVQDRKNHTANKTPGKRPVSRYK